MVAYELLRDQGILIITPDGALVSEDFERLSRVVDEYIVENGALCGLMIYVESFPGWDDFAALISHARFVRDNSADFDRVAAVTDSKIMTIMPGIVDRFVTAEVRHFDFAARADALGWLSSDS